jgi:hypothetical protein
MKLTKAFAQQSRSWILAEVAEALLVIGFLDFVTSVGRVWVETRLMTHRKILPSQRADPIA